LTSECGFLFGEEFVSLVVWISESFPYLVISIVIFLDLFNIGGVWDFGIISFTVVFDWL
jgi:hypothetical protein